MWGVRSGPVGGEVEKGIEVHAEEPCMLQSWVHNYDITHNANIAPQALYNKVYWIIVHWFPPMHIVDRFLHWVSLLDRMVCLYVTHDHEENTLNLRTIHNRIIFITYQQWRRSYHLHWMCTMHCTLQMTVVIWVYKGLLSPWGSIVWQNHHSAKKWPT